MTNTNEQELIEYLAYKTLMTHELDENNKYTFNEVAAKINNTNYLHEILMIRINSLTDREYPLTTNRESIIYIIDRLLDTEAGTELLLNGRIDSLYKNELTYIITEVLTRHPNKINKLCSKYIIRRYYNLLNISDKHRELMESVIIASKLSD